MEVTFGVLGPVVALRDGQALALRGRRHRELLGRLIAARGQVVTVAGLTEDLWADAPAGAAGAIRTFVGELRRVIEPDRAPRAPAGVLVTHGPGYALHLDAGAVDAWRFERAVQAAAALPPDAALDALGEALALWRGAAYADVGDGSWAQGERARLEELRLLARERHAAAALALGRTGEAVADLERLTVEQPWREEAWRLLALALYRSGRQGDALATLRRARSLMDEGLGVEPGAALRRLEVDVLRQAQHLDPPADSAVGRLWASTAAAYDRSVPPRVRLRSSVDMLRGLAVGAGGPGLQAVQAGRLEAVEAAEELGDAELTARVIGGYDVPAIWPRGDDPEQAARIVRAAERALIRLDAGAGDGLRARLLATIAVESRGTGGRRPAEAAAEAERIARGLGDPSLLSFALNGVLMQSFGRTGLAPRRDALGAELIETAARHGLTSFEVLGHLVRLQARGALDDPTGADGHAAALTALAERHEVPLIAVFVRWHEVRRLTLDATVGWDAVAGAYARAVAALESAGMPGMAGGLPALVRLCLRVCRGMDAPVDADEDWGPFEPWARPFVLLAADDAVAAGDAVRAVPDPPADLLQEALWCLVARAATLLNDAETAERARVALEPAAAEIAGAGSGLFALGPVASYLGPAEPSSSRSPSR
ncbi:BTAD domain-containing putative transcriptional regulator [Patulibacter americanus]|uniref:BTAD domain-containing putative transcriptional regulator n=1 Tax=Patulibacter americanus TaxID=588672 RepID=UPI0004920734